MVDKLVDYTYDACLTLKWQHMGVGNGGAGGGFCPPQPTIDYI